MIEPKDRALYMRYLGCLKLLAECSVYLSGPEGEDLRECIGRAMNDACKNHPLTWRRILNRIEIEAKG